MYAKHRVQASKYRKNNKLQNRYKFLKDRHTSNNSVMHQWLLSSDVILKMFNKK